MVFAVIVLVRIFRGRAGPTSVKAAVVFFLVPFFLFSASLRAESAKSFSSLKESLVNLISSTECSFCGIVTDISLDNDKMIYYIKKAEVDTLSGSVRVTSSVPGEDIGVGDCVIGSGTIRAPHGPDNPGGFDEEAYYTVRGTDGLITASKIQKAVGQEERDVFICIKRFLTGLRLDAVGALCENLGPEEAAVMSAVLTGERGLLSDETKDSLTAGGISHILAVSGLHISLVAGGMYSMLMMLFGRKKLSCLITASFLVLYGIFTGMPVSAVRAIIMSSCMLVARMRGKSYDMMSAMAVAGLTILFIRPFYITDSSFIMSFCAAGGAAYGREIVCGARIRDKRLISLITVGGIYLFLIPVLINTYYYVTPYSLIINIAVIPLMSLLVPFGGICIPATVLFGGRIAGFTCGICHYIIKGVIMLCNISKKLPFSKIIIGHRDARIILFYYAVILLVLILIMTARNKRPLWCLVACFVIFFGLPSRGTAVHMLDVGQGECILIEDGGERIMIDAGSTNVKKLYKYRIAPFLKYMGIDSIDHVFLTHADSDHKNGMQELFTDTDLNVGDFICADTKDGGEEIATFSHNECPVRKVAVGDEIRLSSGSIIRIVSPQKDDQSADRNDGSIVFEFTGKNMTALFTGDSSSEVEEEYIGSLSEPEYDILKVAHHGSKYSTSDLLLERISPKIGIISASATNRYGHPAQETLLRLEKAGCRSFSTPVCGYIGIKCDKEKISVAVFKKASGKALNP